MTKEEEVRLAAVIAPEKKRAVSYQMSFVRETLLMVDEQHYQDLHSDVADVREAALKKLEEMKKEKDEVDPPQDEWVLTDILDEEDEEISSW